MTENYFRNNPENGVIGILQSRRSLWQAGRNQFHIKDAMRNNAWCSVTIEGLSLPNPTETFAATYARNSGKPYPSLDEVVIETAGEWGHALHANITFTCYTRSDFEIFDKKWMRTGGKGTISFGYVKPYNGSEQKNIKIDEMYVTTFEFNTDSAGHYICNCKLVGPSRFAESLECKGGLKDQGKFKYKTKSIFGGTETHFVTSLDELLLYDAQENGQTNTDDMADNHKVPNAFGDIIVYHPPTKGGSYAGSSLRDSGRLLQALSVSGDKQYTYNHEYYSLDYVCNRLVNDQLIEFVKKITDSKSKSILDGVKIICNSEVSRGHGYGAARSADPLSILLLGNSKGKYKKGDGTGKDFEKDGEGAGGNIKCHNGDWIDLSKIMLERMVIVGALSKAREKSEVSDKSTQTKPSKRTDVLIYVKQFLDEIFYTISYCTGNMFQLELIENPKNKKELLVVDKNNGNANKLQVFVFDAIDGDGSTRTMNLSSNAGSLEYRGAMFSSVIKQSDIMSTLNGTKNEIRAKRESEIGNTVTQINHKCFVTIPDSGFSGDEIEGLRTLLSAYNQLQVPDTNKNKAIVLYPGLKIDISLDGLWGWKIGNHIHTTHCPKDPYRIESNGLCFNVQSVRHTLKENDWQTDLSGILSFAGPLEYV